jgi:anti-sigma regulatory factor (Ser/Thr protein kinase)
MARQTLSVPGTMSGISLAAAAFEQFWDSAQLPGASRWRFLTALDEVLSNIVRHGMRAGARPIDLTFEFNADVVTVDVSDRGEPFDPLSLPAPDTMSPLEQRKPGGLGVSIVTGLMDGVRYERHAAQNLLVMSWRVRPEAVSPGTSHAD